MEISKNLHFKISAPGKVILHGEHAVVYGKPAIAAAIGSRTYLTLKEHNIDKNVINISFRVFNFVIRTEINTFNILLSNVSLKEIEWDEVEDHQVIFDVLKEFINGELSISEEQDEPKFKTCLSVLYIMCGIISYHKIQEIRNGFTLELSSEIKVGAGLGSSASFAVCLAAAFLIISKRAHSVDEILSSESLNFISKWAFNSEKIMHGIPSGIDNTVCTFGGVLKFKKGLPSDQITIHRVFDILLVDSNVSRSTLKQVQNVSALKHKFPKLMESILTSIGECVDEAAKLYGSEFGNVDSYLEDLSELFQINNGLLRAIGVSHYRLEEIFNIAQKYGFTSKLTGAGGGGYAIILLPYNYKETEHFKNLCSDLKEKFFEWTETTIGVSGISVEFLE